MASKYAKNALKLIFEEYHEDKFSKYGGEPNVPSDFVWPKNSEGKEIPFFMQIDFGYVNKDEVLKNFPTTGLMYIFIDEDAINTSYPYNSGEQYKVMFYKDAKPNDDLQTAKSNSLIRDVCSVDIELFKSYPSPEEFEELYEVFDTLSEEDQDDYCINYHYFGGGFGFLGGWPEIMQSSYLQNDEVQLLSIESIEDEFMWGDLGFLQFYLSEEDLINCNFENVQVNLETT